MAHRPTGSTQADRIRLPYAARRLSLSRWVQSPALAKEESGVFYKSYDVVFTNGEEVEFDKTGEWKEVKCRQSEVPAQIIPEAIRNYVKENYPDTRILQIELDKKEYEIRLSNRLEITFDSKMRVIDIDD